MTTQIQYIIIRRQTDSTAKKNRPIVEEKFVSTDAAGRPRFYTTDRGAVKSALFKLFDNNRLDNDVTALDCFMFDRAEWKIKLELWEKEAELNAEVSNNQRKLVVEQV